jgi:hypothetical protein
MPSKSVLLQAALMSLRYLASFCRLCNFYEQIYDSHAYWEHSDSRAEEESRNPMTGMGCARAATSHAAEQPDELPTPHSVPPVEASHQGITTDPSDSKSFWIGQNVYEEIRRILAERERHQ